MVPGQIHPTVTAVSYTHLDVYKRQEAMIVDFTGEVQMHGTGHAGFQMTERVRSVPVSYTHLDVYKRQFSTCCGGQRATCVKRISP